MLTRIIAIIILICTAGCATNRPDLHDWNQTGGANWALSRGTVTGSGTSEPGFLVSPARYRNFELTVEFKPDRNVNSGILINCQDPGNLQIDNCYEVNIWDDHPKQEYRTGSIVVFASPPREKLDSAKRTGHGIWFHGLPKGMDKRPAQDSEGCVIIDNGTLEQFGAHIRAGESLFVISETLDWLPPSTKQPSADILDAIERWKGDWMAFEFKSIDTHR